MSDQIKHFSHPHKLTPLEKGIDINCNACQRQITAPFHGCAACKHYLHDQCLNAPRSLHHPTHPSHYLTLQSLPTYKFSRFNCNLCRENSAAFSYSCAQCSFDLHLQCALPPPTLFLDNRHPHKLKLILGADLNNFTCNLCKLEADLNYWVYHCGDCDFGMHLSCAIPERWPKMPDHESVADKEAIAPPLGHEGDRHQSLSDKETAAVARPCCKCDGVDYVRVAIDEVTEIQIMLARVQNQLSKAQITTSPNLNVV